MTLAYIFWERFSHSRVLLNSSVWGLRFLSHCLHIPPTHFAYTARTSVFAFTDWQMERVVFDIYSDGLAYPQEWDWHDLRSFCAFLRLLWILSPYPCPHSMNLLILIPSIPPNHFENLNLPPWIFQIFYHPTFKKKKDLKVRVLFRAFSRSAGHFVVSVSQHLANQGQNGGSALALLKPQIEWADAQHL